MEVTYVLLPAADQLEGQTGAVLTVDLEDEERRLQSHLNTMGREYRAVMDPSGQRRRGAWQKGAGQKGAFQQKGRGSRRAWQQGVCQKGAWQ